MKTLKFFPFAVLALILSMACSEDDLQGQNPDDSSEQNSLKSRLLGEWVEAGQKNSYRYAFANDDTIYVKTPEGDTLNKWPYQAIAEDSIRITRGWTTHSKVVFYSNDSIWIGDFMPSMAAVYPPEFGDAVLVRVKAAAAPQENPKLTGVKWKLISFVTNGDAKTPEPEGSNRYWIAFKDDSTLEGKSSVNFLSGSYEVNPQTSYLRVTNLGGTKIAELPDGRFFVESLMAVRSFELQEDALKLYYNEKRDYLLFTPDSSTASGKLHAMEGYIIGYNDCLDRIKGEYLEALGYFFASADFKDTLVAYTFPKDVFIFPVNKIKNSLEPWFEESFMRTFKFRIEYEYALEGDDIGFFCPAMGPALQVPLHIANDMSRIIAIKSAQRVEAEPVYPIEIQAADFSLPDGCTWKRHNGQENVYVIRSVGDILPLIDGEFPENLVDFGKYSLLVAKGQATSGIQHIDKHLQQISENEYLLTIDVMNNDATEVSLWNIAIRVPVVRQNADIRLNLVVNHKDDPIEKNKTWVLTEKNSSSMLKKSLKMTFTPSH